MTGQYLDRKFKRQTTELYTEIGRFVLSFERTCEALRAGITRILDHSGLRDKSFRVPSEKIDINSSALVSPKLSAFFMSS